MPGRYSGSRSPGFVPAFPGFPSGVLDTPYRTQLRVQPQIGPLMGTAHWVPFYSLGLWPPASGLPKERQSAAGVNAKFRGWDGFANTSQKPGTCPNGTSGHEAMLAPVCGHPAESDHSHAPSSAH